MESQTKIRPSMVSHFTQCFQGLLVFLSCLENAVHKITLGIACASSEWGLWHYSGSLSLVRISIQPWNNRSSLAFSPSMRSGSRTIRADPTSILNWITSWSVSIVLTSLSFSTIIPQVKTLCPTIALRLPYDCPLVTLPAVVASLSWYFQSKEPFSLAFVSSSC